MMELLRRDLPMVTDEITPDIRLKKKFRYVDPAFLDGSRVRILTESDDSYKKLVEYHRQMNARGINVRFLDSEFGDAFKFIRAQ